MLVTKSSQLPRVSTAKVCGFRVFERLPAPPALQRPCLLLLRKLPFLGAAWRKSLSPTGSVPRVWMVVLPTSGLPGLRRWEPTSQSCLCSDSLQRLEVALRTHTCPHRRDLAGLGDTGPGAHPLGLRPSLGWSAPHSSLPPLPHPSLLPSPSRCPREEGLPVAVTHPEQRARRTSHVHPLGTKKGPFEASRF